jgi:HD-like signal output (HDOD) protein
MVTAETTRQKIQQQQDLPTLTPDVQRILVACEDNEISQSALAEVLAESPTITARILGLANSAFYGQRGGVQSLPKAISVLGFVTVKSIATGLALASKFDTKRCPSFRPDHYWMSSALSATLAQRIAPLISADFRPPADSAYLAGLLHNIGLLALVHIHPDEMERAFIAHADAPEISLGAHIQSILGTDHYQAGVWLGSQWNFPPELLLVMEHHYNPAYRGDHWPLVLLEGLSCQWADCITGGKTGLGEWIESVDALGLDEPAVEKAWQGMYDQLDRIRAVSAAFSPH